MHNKMRSSLLDQRGGSAWLCWSNTQTMPGKARAAKNRKYSTVQSSVICSCFLFTCNLQLSKYKILAKKTKLYSKQTISLLTLIVWFKFILFVAVAVICENSRACTCSSSFLLSVQNLWTSKLGRRCSTNLLEPPSTDHRRPEQ